MQPSAGPWHRAQPKMDVGRETDRKYPTQHMQISVFSSLHPQQFGLIYYLSPLGPTMAFTAYSTNFNLLSIQGVIPLLIF